MIKLIPEPIRAKIAQLFVQEGFDYLRSMQSKNAALSHQRTIEEAIGLSNHLTLQMIRMSAQKIQ